MDVTDFAAVFDDAVKKADETLNGKRAEYAGAKVDVLHNFRQAAHLEQCSMRQSLGGFLAKHIVSVFDMIHEETPRDLAVWDEKVGDAINYLILLKAIVLEELTELADEEREKQRPTIINHPSSSRPRLESATLNED